MDLAEFLLACIAKDEAKARTAGEEHWPIETRTEHYGAAFGHAPTEHRYVLGMELVRTCGDNAIDPADGEHIARWDPARVLAECEAKRLIVAEARDAHRAEVSIRETFADFPNYPRASVERASYSARAGAWYGALCLLALPYADHPDYRPEWKP